MLKTSEENERQLIIIPAHERRPDGCIESTASDP